MMRIAFDGRALNTSLVRGTGKYAYELLRQGAQRPDLHFTVFGDEPRRPMQVPVSPRIETRVWETRGHRLRAWEQVSLPAATRRAGCDLFHAVGMQCPIWQPVPTVVTIHDTLAWQAPHSFYRDTVLPAAFRRADAIITISDASKRDILARWPALADRLHVIYHGIDAAYLAENPPPLPRELIDAGVRPPYVLYFGGEIPRKRLPYAVDVWNRLRRDDVSLVLCGVQPASLPALRETVAPSRRGRLVCPGFIKEQDLPALYTNAQAVLYPTLYEGFGFPALESQAAGTPILMSAVGSLVELIGPASIVLEPDDVDGWTVACASALDGRRPSPAVCREWAGRFRWADTFERVLAVYRDAVRRHRVRLTSWASAPSRSGPSV